MEISTCADAGLTSFPLTMGWFATNQDYIIDLRGMAQFNLKTKATRKIRKQQQIPLLSIERGKSL